MGISDKELEDQFAAINERFQLVNGKLDTTAWLLAAVSVAVLIGSIWNTTQGIQAANLDTEIDAHRRQIRNLQEQIDEITTPSQSLSSQPPTPQGYTD